MLRNICNIKWTVTLVRERKRKEARGKHVMNCTNNDTPEKTRTNGHLRRYCTRLALLVENKHMPQHFFCS